MSEIFDKIISFESLYKAHRRARLGKRHKKEVVAFEMNLSESLWSLHYDLLYKKYKCGGYHNFTIYDPKERIIEAISYRDRILQHTLCDNYLTPLTERYLVYSSCACRKGKGTSLAVRLLRKYLAEHYANYGKRGYFIKLDIHKYFDTIDHSLLKSKLKKLHIPKDVLSIVNDVIDSFEEENDKGLPKGNQTSQIFANLYLNDVDRYIKEILRVKKYVRYMDDMIILVPTKKEASTIFKRIAERVKEERLSLNPKSEIVAIKSGINFLGWRFYIGKNGALIQKVRTEAKKRIYKKLKRKIISSCEEKIRASIVSYRGFLQRANAYWFFGALERLA